MAMTTEMLRRTAVRPAKASRALYALVAIMACGGPEPAGVPSPVQDAAPEMGVAEPPVERQLGQDLDPTPVHPPANAGTGGASPDVADGDPDTVAAQTAKANDPDAPARTLWELECGGASIAVAVTKATGEHLVEFGGFQAQLEMLGTQPTSLVVDVATQTATSDHPMFERDIRSARILDVLRYPRANFRSTSIRRVGGEAGDRETYRVEGKLVIRGTPQHIAFTAVVGRQAERLIGRTQVEIDVSAHGLHGPVAQNELVDSKLNFEIELRFRAPNK